VLSAPFVGFERTPAPLPRHAPLLGADGATVLGEIGYTQDRIAALVASGVVGASS
jgi:crotonobetainyl-CoA:carnitine CoA-transferase CaiB-like acyl-CoA transferase